MSTPKYGRERAALAATVIIAYRGKSAVRDVARRSASRPTRSSSSATCSTGGTARPASTRGCAARFRSGTPILRGVLRLTRELLDAPRHLSQHVGGFVISDEALHALVPVENAAMPERSVIQWDKDDLESRPGC